MSLTTIAQELLDQFVSVYRPTIEERLEARGLVITPEVDAAIDAGELWLAGELEGLLALPFAEQRRSPLEVFQEAARFPTEALRSSGVPPVERDRVATAALPGDSYDLAPPSSQELTADAWRAHLAWGAAKAQVMSQRVRRPLAGLFSRNLMDRSKIEEEVRAAGYDVFLLRNLDLIERAMEGKRPPVAFVDLEGPEVDQVIRVLAGAGVEVIAYGPHVDDLGLERARSLGARVAVARSRFFGRVGEYLPQII